MKFLLHTQIGVEKIALLELEEKFKGKYSLDFTAFVPNKNGLIQVDWQDESTQLDFYKNLNCIENAFLILDYVNNIPEKDSVLKIYSRIDKKNVEKNLKFFFDNYTDLKFADEKKIRLITRKKSPNDFLRSDLHKSIELLLKNHMRNVRVNIDEGSYQVWTTLIKNRLIVTIRLAKDQIEYENTNLDSSIASSISYIADIKSNDSIWNPYAKSGVLSAEILRNKKFKKLILSESNTELIESAKTNLSLVENYKKNKGKVSFRAEDFLNSNNYADILISQLPIDKTNLVDQDFVNAFFNKINGIKELKKLILLYPAIIENQNWLLYKNYQLRVNGIRMNLMVYQRQS